MGESCLLFGGIYPLGDDGFVVFQDRRKVVCFSLIVIRWDMSELVEFADQGTA